MGELYLTVFPSSFAQGPFTKDRWAQGMRFRECTPQNPLQ